MVTCFKLIQNLDYLLELLVSEHLLLLVVVDVSLVFLEITAVRSFASVPGRLVYVAQNEVTMLENVPMGALPDHATEALESTPYLSAIVSFPDFKAVSSENKSCHLGA